MSSTPLEDMLVGLHDFTKSNLYTYLKEIEGEVGDTIELPDFDTYEFGYSDVFGRTRYPVILFVPGEISSEGTGNQSRTYEMIVDVVMAITDNDAAELARKQLRYADAFANMIDSDYTVGDVCELAEVIGVEPYPASSQSKTLTVVLISVRMIQELVQ